MPGPRDFTLATLQSSLTVIDQAIAHAQRQQRDLDQKLAAAAASRQAIERQAVALPQVPDPDLPQASADALQVAATGLNEAGSLIQNIVRPAEGSALDEWKECRSTIDRCDKLLVDIRKTGFGFVTAVLGAATFVFGRGDHVNNTAKSLLFCILVMLITVLYSIDLSHQSWLGQAVQRARTLEQRPELQFRLTQQIGDDFAASKAVLLGAVIYAFLLISSGLIFWTSIPLAQEDLFSAPRANMYGAFAFGMLAIIVGPLVAARYFRSAGAVGSGFLIAGLLLLASGYWRL